MEATRQSTSHSNWRWKHYAILHGEHAQAATWPKQYHTLIGGERGQTATGHSHISFYMVHVDRFRGTFTDAFPSEDTKVSQSSFIKELDAVVAGIDLRNKTKIQKDYFNRDHINMISAQTNTAWISKLSIESEQTERFTIKQLKI